MSNSSEASAAGPQFGNGFFSPAQIMAFSRPPSKEALGEVSVGGKQKEKYVLGDYITLLLNMYVGQGLWDKQVEFLGSHDEILTKQRKKKVNGHETGEWEQYEQLVVSATVKVSLIIYNARDPEGPTRRYEAVCVGTNFTDPNGGRAAALDKAIKSAETDGLKRTSKNLGRAFGLDLKEKIKANSLPPKLSDFQAKFDEMMANYGKTNNGVVLALSNTPAEPRALEAPRDKPATAEPSPARKPDAAVEQAPASAPEQKRETKPEPAPVQDTAPAAKPEETPRTAEPIEVLPPLAEGEKGPASESKGEAKPAGNANPVNLPPWDLTMIPSNYDQWLACLWEINNRLKLMRHAQEIENFRTRYKRLIEKLPVLPPEGGKEGRNFKLKFSRMVSERYQELGLPEPGNAPTNTANVAPLPDNV